MKINTATLVTVAALCMVGITNHAAAQPATHTNTPMDCEEDEPCWDCATMGNHLCSPLPHPPHVIATHRMVPWQIRGTFHDGFTVWYTDGDPAHNYSTSEGTWPQQLAECKTDDHPAVCVAVWGTERQHLADEKVMLRLAAQS